jgi:outer membrane protein TolC
VRERVFAQLTLDQAQLSHDSEPSTQLSPVTPLPDVKRDSGPPTSTEGREAGPQFTLPEAVAFGIRNNPRLLAAIAAIERTRGQEQVAFAPFLPEIDFLTHFGVTSPTLGPASAGSTGIIIPTVTETHSYAQAEVQLQWTLYDFGRTAGRYQQAEARARIASLQARRAEETIGYDVASAYLLALQSRAVRLIQEESIRRAEATLRDTRSRRAAGVAEKDDVLRGEVQLAAAREDLDIARQAELSAIARLNNAMGRNASLPLSVTAEEAPAAFSLSLVQCLEMAAARRPEIGIARDAIAAAQSGWQATAAEYLPRVYALASAGVVGGSNIETGPQEGVGLHIDLPLFTGGRRRGELRTADADVRQAIADARSILDGVTLQVTLAYLAATTARRRIELDRPAIVEARENLRLVGNRYRNGQATPTDIVDAEVALTRAQQRLTSATYEYLGALAGLDYALGNPTGQLLGLVDNPADSNPRPEVLPTPRPLPKVE